MKRPFTPHNTKAVFFDMNNTLVDSAASFEACFLSVLADFAGRWDDGDGRLEPRQALETYRSEWSKQASRLRARPKEAEKAKRLCLETALSRYPFRVNDEFARSFFREMRNQAREHATLVPHARETVARLSGAYRVGIITNGGKEQQEKVIGRLGLSAYVDFGRVFASGQSGARKPHSAIFQNALRKVGVKPAEAVMIGDSWKNDVTGALKCGMNAVWLKRTGDKPSSSRKVGKLEVPVARSLKEVGELFAT